jgi:hypothetical protein
MAGYSPGYARLNHHRALRRNTTATPSADFQAPAGSLPRHGERQHHNGQAGDIGGNRAEPQPQSTFAAPVSASYWSRLALAGMASPSPITAASER